MKKEALIIGGSNGIGLAIAKLLIEEGYFVNILDICTPEDGVLSDNSFKFEYCNLLYLDEEYVSSYVDNKNISLLMITAGIGRVADFEYFHTAEINKIMTINATSTLRIISLFYDRIRGDKEFYCGVMGSISGLMSSPSAAVYAASKAAVCRFIESINIELEMNGFQNRILNIEHNCTIHNIGRGDRLVDR